MIDSGRPRMGHNLPGIRPLITEVADVVIGLEDVLAVDIGHEGILLAGAATIGLDAFDVPAIDLAAHVRAGDTGGIPV